MTLSRANKVHLDTGPNLIPLVDVVMVLLIFLMMVGSFAGAEHYLVSTLPITAIGPGAINSSFDPMTQLDIRVDSQRHQDTFTATVGRVQTQDANSLRLQLQQRAGHVVVGGDDDQRAVVVEARPAADLLRVAREQQPFGSGLVALGRQEGAYLSAQLKPRAQRSRAELHRTVEDVLHAHNSRSESLRNVLVGARGGI